MKLSRLCTRALASTSLVAVTALFSQAAWAGCVADATGLNVSCTTSSTGYSATASNTAITVTSGTSITGTGLVASGSNSSVDNLGTINTGAGVTAISLGGGGLVTQEATASGAITGNILFAATTAPQVNRLTNLDTKNGIVGNVTSIGNTTINNSGLITGNITQTTSSGADTVLINNVSGATITGTITTADNTTLVNGGKVTGATSTTAALSVTNTGTIDGAITSTTPTTGTGNLSITNSGTITGDITETAGSAAGIVTITNSAGGTLTGNINTAEKTTFTNAGTFVGTFKTPAAVTSTINNSGTMTTSGAFTGSLTNSGTLGIGSNTTTTTAATSTTAEVTTTTLNPGLLTIDGNYTQTAGTLNVALVSSDVAGTGFSQIHTTGTSTLAGTINVTPAQGFYPTGSTYNVVLADQGVTNNGVTVTGIGPVSPFLTFTSNGVVSTGDAALPNQQAFQIEATRTASYSSVIAPTASANQLAVAAGFQPLVTTANADPTGDAAALVGGVDFMTVAEAEKFFDQVSPQGYGAYVTALQNQGNIFSRQINLRLDTLVTMSEAVGLWLTPYYQRGKSGGRPYGSSEDIFGISVGYDVGDERARAGLSLGFSNASVNYNVGNLKGNDNSFQVGAYGGLTFGHLNTNLQLDYISGSITSTKTLDLGTVIRTAAASTSSNLFKVVGTLGYDLGGTKNKIRPFIGFDLSKGKIKGFTETGAGTANLTVGGLNADRNDVLAGLDYAMQTGTIRPYMRVAYRYNLNNPNTQITALFNADPTTSFVVTDTVPSRAQEDVDFGARLQADDDGSYFSFGYQGTFRGGLTSHGISTSLFVAL